MAHGTLRVMVMKLPVCIWSDNTFLFYLHRCIISEKECEKLREKVAEQRRKLEDMQAALQELGRENQTLQVIYDHNGGTLLWCTRGSGVVMAVVELILAGLLLDRGQWCDFTWSWEEEVNHRNVGKRQWIKYKVMKTTKNISVFQQNAHYQGKQHILPRWHCISSHIFSLCVFFFFWLYRSSYLDKVLAHSHIHICMHWQQMYTNQLVNYITTEFSAPAPLHCCSFHLLGFSLELGSTCTRFPFKKGTDVPVDLHQVNADNLFFINIYPVVYKYYQLNSIKLYVL